jgi:hypothetical protein
MSPLLMLLLASTPASALDLPVTRTTIDEHVVELVPIIEEITGRRFERTPEAEIARSDELRQALVREVEEHLVRILPNIPRPMARLLAGTQAEAMTGGMMGKYLLEDRKVYVHPRAIVWAVRDEDLPFEHVAGMTRLVLAHELTHALQDQIADIGTRVSEVRSLDQLHALTAAVEGHATAVQEAVAERLGLQAEAASLAALQGAGDPASPGAFFYGQGRSFVEAASADPWEVLLEPPTTTHEVLFPKDWRSPPARPLVGEAPWERVAKALAIEDWPVVRVDHGTLDLQTLLQRDGAEISGEGFVGGDSWVAAGNTGVVRLRVYTFTDEAHAAAVLEAWRARAPKAPEGPTSPYAPAVIVTSPLPVALDHVRVGKAAMPSGRAGPPTQAVWGVDGPRLVVVEIEELKPAEDSLAAALTGALSAR